MSAAQDWSIGDRVEVAHEGPGTIAGEVDDVCRSVVVRIDEDGVDVVAALAQLSRLDETGEEVEAASRPRARDLRIVDNRTAEFDGGFSVELADGSVLAGPYAVRDDATQAKADLLAGRPVEGAR